MYSMLYQKSKTVLSLIRTLRDDVWRVGHYSHDPMLPGILIGYNYSVRTTRRSKLRTTGGSTPHLGTSSPRLWKQAHLRK